MSGDMRPELSPNSEFWIERHRYYELKHFCLQYRAWKRTVALLDGYGETSISKPPVHWMVLLVHR